MKRKIVVLIFCIGIIGRMIELRKTTTRKFNEIKMYSDKHLSLFFMMNQWVKIKQEGKNLSSYFIRNNYRKIAIYGMNYVGKTLVEELNGTDVEIVYGIDRNANYLCEDINIVSIEDKLIKVDAIVVTAITFYDEIKNQLYNKIDCPIISLEDILIEM